VGVSTDPAASGGDGSQAKRRGSRRALLYGAVLAVVAVAILVAVLAGGHGGSASAGLGQAGSAARHARSSAKYGGLPSWLPKPKVVVHRVPNASAAHPWLSAIEGETVSVKLAGGHVLATIVGPSIPEEVAEKAQHDDDDSDTAPCTFTATFMSASGSVPLHPSAFTILDERGQVHRLLVTGADGGPVPSEVAPGRTVTLTMKATLPEGEGALRWAPDGPRVLAGWVFGLELD
jgi:hypothetical protein